MPQVAADSATAKALEYGMKVLTVEIKGPGSGVKLLLEPSVKGFKILSIKDTTHYLIMEQDHQKRRV